MEYTKGKWEVLVNSCTNSCYIKSDAGVIANIRTSQSNYKANAQLISAAPRMYEGIEKALNILDGKLLVVTNEDLDKLKQVKAILNKAKADS